ncbi:MAG: DUF1801 domain-containing protein [Dehalococcoidia bacterium]|nr:DUF1801 domain-containing protein [Dehalococcoidia bacterium]
MAEPGSVDEYIAGLPEERRGAIGSLRDLILTHLPEGYSEEMDFGMIAYVVPLAVYPQTYNGHPLMYAALASQKNYMSLYLMNIYGDPETYEWFTEEFKARGKKLDMGKSCVRFKKLDDLPMDVIGQAIAKTPSSNYIDIYEASRRKTKKGR